MADVADVGEALLTEPVTVPVEAHVSEDYARAERDRLWRRVWQQVGRVEEIPEVGDFLTYDILDDSIVIVRSAPDRVSAHFNVCQHRGRRLVDTPDGARNAVGKKKMFICGFHGWRYDLDGACTHVARSGTAWQIFPNFQIGHSVNNLLCYSARPYGSNPDKCYFEAAVYQLYPRGEAPETQWEHTAPSEWPPVLQQDFANMAAVQKGMKSLGFSGTKPNPYAERSVANLHRNLAKYMGTGAPRPLE